MPANQNASNFRHACQPVSHHQELNTGLKLLFFFQKELNTIPSKYMLRRAQTNQQKLLNLEFLKRLESESIGGANF